ncbi:hypothetical protein [Rhodococcus jostii]|uniref:hypothetical protein n=1 Tax=Rhodococcus jostii TaxID=132919 RepID=UPI00364FA964
MTHELAILQAARLKGRLGAELAAQSVGVDVETAATELTALRDAGYFKGDPQVRLTPEGRTRLSELAASERTTIDHEAMMRLYHEFDQHNTALKEIISDWQMKGGAPNDHTDITYDHSVLDRLTALDEGFQPLVQRMAAIAGRLSNYRRRFRNAIEQIQAGDTGFVARPIADSYHTVWFEFHEELIGLLGLSREEEAAAGRAV